MEKKSPYDLNSYKKSIMSIKSDTGKITGKKVAILAGLKKFNLMDCLK